MSCAIVTGSSRGIGSSCALAFAKAGYQVAVNCNHNLEAGKQVLEDIHRTGGKAILVQADVSTSAGAQLLIEETLRAFGGIDVLINNVGITDNAPFADMGENAFLHVMDVNINSTFYCAQLAFRVMKDQGYGRILNITSIAGLLGNAQQVNYAGAKAAVIGMTKSMARACAPFGVTVNAIAPGYVETELLHTLPDELLEEIRAGIPIPRFASAEEIADLALFLASPSAGYINGQTIAVDGGLTM